MDTNTAASLRPSKGINVRSTGPNPTQLWEKVLPLSQCLSIRRGCHTLTRGRSYNPFPQKMTKTSPTSYRVLLSNVHPNWMKLWHLQQGVASRHESTVPLATIPSLDKRTLHNPDWPCKSHILEGSEETRSKTCPMACRPRRIQLRDGTHPWKHKWAGQCTIITPRNWQRGKW